MARKKLFTNNRYPMTTSFDLSCDGNVFTLIRDSKQGSEIEIFKEAISGREHIKNLNDTMIFDRINVYPTSFLAELRVLTTLARHDVVADTTVIQEIDIEQSGIQVNEEMLAELIQLIAPYVYIEIRRQDRLLFKRTLLGILKDNRLGFILRTTTDLKFSVKVDSKLGTKFNINNYQFMQRTQEISYAGEPILNPNIVLGNGKMIFHDKDPVVIPFLVELDGTLKSEVGVVKK